MVNKIKAIRVQVERRSGTVQLSNWKKGGVKMYINNHI